VDYSGTRKGKNESGAYVVYSKSLQPRLNWHMCMQQPPRSQVIDKVADNVAEVGEWFVSRTGSGHGNKLAAVLISVQLVSPKTCA
jgi:hypothetical protein